MDTRIECRYLFGDNQGAQVARQKALSGALRFSGVRSVCWKVFLTLLPDDMAGWRSTLAQHREHYRRLRARYVLDEPRRDAEDDPHFQTPREEAGLADFFKTSELKTQIARDMDRLFVDHGYFQTPEVKDMMTRILFIWARQNSEIGYRQGMHEVLAPLIFVLGKEGSDRGEGDVEVAMDRRFVEHDAFGLFSRMMQQWKWVYAPPAPTPSRTERRVSLMTMEAKEREKQGSLLWRCARVHRILRQVDTDLHRHLVKFQVHPQLYALSWIRLLFVREFSFEDLLVLWDALLATSTNLDLVEFVCVAMLVHRSRGLLEALELVGCLTQLKQPFTEMSISELVNAAVVLRRDYGDLLGRVPWEKGESPDPENLLRAPSMPSVMDKPRPPSPLDHISRNYHAQSMADMHPIMSSRESMEPPPPPPVKEKDSTPGPQQASPSDQGSDPLKLYGDNITRLQQDGILRSVLMTPGNDTGATVTFDLRKEEATREDGAHPADVEDVQHTGSRQRTGSGRRGFTPLMEGFLKYSRHLLFMRRNLRMWCALDENILALYPSEQSISVSECIHIATITRLVSYKRKTNKFEIHTPYKTYTFVVKEGKAKRDEWVEHILLAVERNTARSHGADGGQRSLSHMLLQRIQDISEGGSLTDRTSSADSRESFVSSRLSEVSPSSSPSPRRATALVTTQTEPIVLDMTTELLQEENEALRKLHGRITERIQRLLDNLREEHTPGTLRRSGVISHVISELVDLQGELREWSHADPHH